jgi:hypothetical protein
VVLGFLWLLLLNPTWGPVAQGLRALNLEAWVNPWLGDRSTALVTIILVNAWAWLGFPILVYLAGLQGIPREYHEAALIDGANPWQDFRFVTLPMLMPTIAMVTILTFIWDFNAFELVFVMQGPSGSPNYATDLLATYFYRTAFGDPTTGGEAGQIGIAAAIRFRDDWHRARRWNAIGLTLASLYLLWTVLAQQWMENRASQAVADAELPVERMLATPTAVNSVLWRIVAVGEEAHWEALHPVWSRQPIRFREYPRDPELLDDIEDNSAVRRLQYFTRGFYSVNERDGTVVISDLRMGQVGYYAFAYRVGRREDGRIRPIPDERYRYPRPDLFVALRDLYACALDRPTQQLDCREASIRP